MKRWNWGSFVLGVLVAALVLSLAAPALASGMKIAELYYNDITIRLNGEKVVPKDVNGTPVDPFIIDGTTYLPLRAIASALGLDVDWDDANKTVILGDDSGYGVPAAWLGELDAVAGSPYETITADQPYNDQSTANNGETFARRLAFGSDGASYFLNGQYTRLTGTFYLSAHSKNDSYAKRLLIYSDGNLIYTSPEMGSGIEPIDFTINVSGCSQLTILCQRKSGDAWFDTGLTSSGYFYIGNAALWTD